MSCLADSHGQIPARETIYQRVWGYAVACADRSADLFIRKLRQNLEKASPLRSDRHTHETRQHFAVFAGWRPISEELQAEDFAAWRVRGAIVC